MGLIWLALAAIAVWALVRLGRHSEAPTGQGGSRGHWRIAATLLGAVMLGGGVLAASRGAGVAAAALIGAGGYLIFSSRIRPPAPRGDRMGLAEARSILGVSAEASDQAVNAAWRRLMSRAHPDQGGTEGLAARLNAARDRLLKP